MFLGILHGYRTTFRNYASILIRNSGCGSHLGVLPTPPAWNLTLPAKPKLMVPSFLAMLSSASGSTHS